MAVVKLYVIQFPPLPPAHSTPQIKPVEPVTFQLSTKGDCGCQEGVSHHEPFFMISLITNESSESWH